MVKYFSKITHLLVLFFLFFFLVGASGGSNTSLQTESFPNPLGANNVVDLVGLAIKTIVGVVGSIALFMFVWGGFLWMTSMGNKDRVKQGTEIMKWTALGLAAIFLSYLAVSYLVEFLSNTSSGTSSFIIPPVLAFNYRNLH